MVNAPAPTKRLDISGRDPDTLTPREVLAYAYPEVYALVQELAAAEATIARVRKVHHLAPYAPAYDPYCEECGPNPDDAWPCPTLRALDGEPASG